MTDTWDEARLQQYIDDGTEESLKLDYKAADSLSKNDRKKIEITKDVSAMANSDGGIIIYGIAEYQEKEKSHLPEKLDPVDRTEFSKEWLEQIINTISPKIDGVRIYPVDLSSGSNNVAYVVDIPQSNTAHQARDHRYYKRFNFMSVPMEDYEIRDVMGRGQHPKIELVFRILKVRDSVTLYIEGRNNGNAYAQYVVVYLAIPEEIARSQKGKDWYGNPKVYTSTNYTFRSPEPILPGLENSWEVELNPKFDENVHKDLFIKWKAHADNAPARYGKTQVADILVEER